MESTPYCCDCKHFRLAKQHSNERDQLEFGRCAKYLLPSGNRFVSPVFDAAEFASSARMDSFRCGQDATQWEAK